MNEMAVTLVLCSRNGSRTIGRCLEHIRSMDGVASIEILLVDNGSTDNTLELMRDFSRGNPELWRVVQEPKPGNSAGRNAGIVQSSGELVLFMDDDCYPDANFVSAWKTVFDRDSQLGFGTGRILPFDSNKSTIGCNTSTVLRIVPPATFFHRGLVQGSNMAFRRSCLTQAGLFDSRFGAGTPFAGEEWDVALRVSFAGWKGGYFPEPTVAHDHGRSDGDASVRSRYYDIGAGAVYAKHLLTRHAFATAVRLGSEIVRHARDWPLVSSVLKGMVQYYGTSTTQARP